MTLVASLDTFKASLVTLYASLKEVESMKIKDMSNEQILELAREIELKVKENCGWVHENKRYKACVNELGRRVGILR